MRRLIYVFAGLLVTVLSALLVGPHAEASLWPIRVNQTVFDVRRDAKMVSFVWESEKLRAPPLEDLTVFLFSPTDRYLVPLYRDTSAEDQPCLSTVPLSLSQRSGIGSHRLRYCVEVPHAVPTSDALRISIVAHYRGLGGLWDLPQAMDISVPAALDVDELDALR